ncbi:MAG: aspartate aminotransferase family protein [Hyphomicrobiales bacterium]
MDFNIEDLIDAQRPNRSQLHERHLNTQLVNVLRTLGFDVDYVRAEGAYLFDAEGTRYLDLLSGFGVFALGRSHQVVADTLKTVIDLQLPGLVQFDTSILAGLMAETLNRYMPWLEKYYFCNSGTEAVEASIKFSRFATGRSRILYCSNAFHGLTYGALSVTADAQFRQGFGPLLEDCTEIPFDDVPALERELRKGDVAAFIVEPIQGKGVYLPGETYLAKAANLCRSHNAVFIADEVQTGLGRTGRFIACEHWNVEPDIVLLAKALSGGFVPVGAVACRKWIFDAVFDRMDRVVVHGSTFSKNDLAMAAGLATLAAIENEQLIQLAERRGERLIDTLHRRCAGKDFDVEVRGRGLMIGVEIGAPRSLGLKTAYKLIEETRRGLFCQLLLVPMLKEHRILAQVAGAHQPVIKLLPPFIIDNTDITWIGRAFDAVLRDAENLGGIWDLGYALAKHSMQARAAAGTGR